MNEQPAWQWNEMQQVGTDYANVAEVERYEQRMGEFRNLPAEDAAISDILALPEGSHILEIGTGTGHFARVAARAGHRVTALDVSSAMLQYAKARAKAEELTGIEFCHAGFLTFTASPATFDAAVSVAVLHHLPRFVEDRGARQHPPCLEAGRTVFVMRRGFLVEGSPPSRTIRRL